MGSHRGAFERDEVVVARKVGIAGFLVAIAIAGLQFQGAGVDIPGVSVIPMTTLICSLALPLVLLLYPQYPSNVLIAVGVFAGYAVLHSLIWVLLDEYAASDMSQMRLEATVRQLLALFGGLSVFLVLRTLFVRLPDRILTHWMLWWSIPSLLLATLNILWGITGLSGFGDIVVGVRSALVPGGYIDPHRATGLSLEPAYFAIYLVIVVLPACLLTLTEYGRGRRLLYRIWLVLAVISLAWTFSLIGFFLVGAMAAAIFLMAEFRQKFKLAAGFVVVVGILASISLFAPNNYLIAQFEHVRTLMSGEGAYNDSSGDIYYSNLGPVMALPHSLVILGYGLGGSAIHLDDILPEEGRDLIARIRWEELPQLGTLAGRVLADLGLIGIALLGVVFWVVWRKIDRLPQRALHRALWLGLLLAIVVKLGSFAFPYLWVWLAYWDASEHKLRNVYLSQTDLIITPRH